MRICQEYGQPEFFITFTGNPKWKEIQDHLKQGGKGQPSQKAEDRPDLVARVFKRKLDLLLNDLVKGDLLGRVVAHLAVVEWQKRGMPHAHILIIVAPGDRIVRSDQVDTVISAELPPAAEDTDDPDEKEQRARLQDIVLGNMTHGPCGSLYPKQVCMVDGKCSKSYPKPFSKHTTLDPSSGFPTYR